NCAAFQAADEMRLIQRLAYRVTQLRQNHGGFADKDRGVWEESPVWQPLRVCLEELLVTWDWAEAFVALNLVLKPHLDVLYLSEFAELGAVNGDPRLGEVSYSFVQDAEWHRAWSASLVKCILNTNGENRTILKGWIEKWLPAVREAIEGFRPIFEEAAP